MLDVGILPGDYFERLTPAEITNPFDLLHVLNVYNKPDYIAGSVVRAWLAEHRDEVRPELLENLQILAQVSDLIGNEGADLTTSH